MYAGTVQDTDQSNCIFSQIGEPSVCPLRYGQRIAMSYCCLSQFLLGVYKSQVDQAVGVTEVSQYGLNGGSGWDAIFPLHLLK